MCKAFWNWAFVTSTQNVQTDKTLDLPPCRYWSLFTSVCVDVCVCMYRRDMKEGETCFYPPRIKLPIKILRKLIESKIYKSIEKNFR